MKPAMLHVDISSHARQTTNPFSCLVSLDIGDGDYYDKYSILGDTIQNMEFLPPELLYIYKGCY